MNSWNFSFLNIYKQLILSASFPCSFFWNCFTSRRWKPEQQSTAHCTLHTAHYTLHTAHCPLHTTHFKIHTSHYTLHTVRCTLHTEYDTLYTAWCALDTLYYANFKLAALSKTALSRAHYTLHIDNNIMHTINYSLLLKTKQRTVHNGTFTLYIATRT